MITVEDATRADDRRLTIEPAGMASAARLRQPLEDAKIVCRRQRPPLARVPVENRVAAPTGLPRRMTTPVAGERVARAAGAPPQSRLRAVPLKCGVI
jgi:hypothetical protein